MNYIIDTNHLNSKLIKKLKVGDRLYLHGRIYTARDQVHHRLHQSLKTKKRLPICLKDKVIYYTGPTPKIKKMVIGSCGPTTSSRMDGYTPALVNEGVKILIGKGGRSKEVIESLKKNKGIYAIAPAGCGAYLSTKVLKSKPIAYKELGAEAIYELEVKNFPVIVCIDSKGNYLYK
jgi:fumarate hydratase subunit beta